MNDRKWNLRKTNDCGHTSFIMRLTYPRIFHSLVMLAFHNGLLSIFIGGIASMVLRRLWIFERKRSLPVSFSTDKYSWSGWYIKHSNIQYLITASDIKFPADQQDREKRHENWIQVTKSIWCPADRSPTYLSFVCVQWLETRYKYSAVLTINHAKRNVSYSFNRYCGI